MIKAQIPVNELERLAALKSYELLDTEEELIYSQLTLLASQICETKISLISLIDENRQWFKSRHGLAATETPRELAFCSHAILNNQAFIISDARLDERFSDNPLVTGAPNVIFYAGIPLTDAEGFPLGTLCVIDEKPKQLSATQLQGLQIIADQVVAQFRLRRELAQKKNYEKQFSRLAAEIPGAIYQYKLNTDGTSCFPYASAGITAIYEVTPEDIKLSAEKIQTRLHPEDIEHVVESFRKSAKTLENWNMDYRVILPKAGLRWLRGSAKPEVNADKSIVWHGFIADVTEEKNLEAQLYQNSKLAALGEMASGIAHEINNPLSIIIGKASLLQNHVMFENLNQNRVVQDIAKLEATALRISKIIKGLTAFSRNAENDSHSVIEVKTIIEDTLSLVSEKFKYHEIDIVVKCEDQLDLKCNATQIGQVLMNLLINSFDAVKNLKEKWIQIEVTNSSDILSILISDSGTGISPKIAEKIMHPFFTTKSVGEGTGLGLSLSKGLIESHGGKLNYLPQFKNTTFSIALPLSGKAALKNVA